MNIINLKHFDLFNYHILLWWNSCFEFKCIKVDTKMYKKYSLYIGKLICEVGQFKYGTNNKSVRTINK
jgi:hypothetical protein